jgi:hypothetical protein
MHMMTLICAHSYDEEEVIRGRIQDFTLSHA